MKKNEFIKYYIYVILLEYITFEFNIISGARYHLVATYSVKKPV